MKGEVQGNKQLTWVTLEEGRVCRTAGAQQALRLPRLFLRARRLKLRSRYACSWTWPAR